MVPPLAEPAVNATDNDVLPHEMLVIVGAAGAPYENCRVTP